MTVVVTCKVRITNDACLWYCWALCQLRFEDILFWFQLECISKLLKWVKH